MTDRELDDAVRRFLAGSQRPRRRLDHRLFANIIGGALIGGFLAALIVLFIIPIPTDNEQLITYMIGQLSGFAGGIISYHYASKSGDRDLDAIHADTASKAMEMAGAVVAGNGQPQPVTVTNDQTNPVPVEEPKP